MSKANVTNPWFNNIYDEIPVPAAISKATNGSLDFIFNNSIHLVVNYYYTC